MHAFIRSTVLTLLCLFTLSIPAFADTGVTKEALSKMIYQETKQKVSPSDIKRIVKAVYREADRHSLDPILILSFIQIESTYNARAKSKEGAKGLMQVIPKYHKDKIKGRDVFNIETNIEVGTQIFVNCLESNKWAIAKATRCYSGGAKNYVGKLEKGFTKARKAILLYRFQNELPITTQPNFKSATTFSTSVRAGPSIVLADNPVTEVSVY